MDWWRHSLLVFANASLARRALQNDRTIRPALRHWVDTQVDCNLFILRANDVRISITRNHPMAAQTIRASTDQHQIVDEAASRMIDTPEFMQLLSNFAEQSASEVFDEAAYDAARQGVVAHVKTAMLETSTRYAAAIKARTLETQAMADCMDMVRNDLVEAGIIGANVAPMFIPEAIVKKLQEVAASKDTSVSRTDLQFKNEHGNYLDRNGWDITHDTLCSFAFAPVYAEGKVIALVLAGGYIQEWPEQLDRNFARLTTAATGSTHEEDRLHTATLERAIHICEEIESDRFDAYKGRGKHEAFSTSRGDVYVNGQSDGAGQCAIALRTLHKSLRVQSGSALAEGATP